MSRRLRRIWTITLTLALATGVAALAWACTPSAYLTLDRASGTPGTSVTVSGQGFANGPVQISWNGSVLATATGPSFSTSVSIPSSAPGVYYLQAIARHPDGTVAGQASRAFRLTAAPVQAPAAEPPVARVQEEQGSSREQASSTPATRARSEAKPVQAPAARSVEPQATPSPPPTSAPVRKAEAGRPGTDPRARTPSNDDLWSGFEGDGGSALSGRLAAPESNGPGVGASIALLALGLLALGGGCTVAVARRRRAQ